MCASMGGLFFQSACRVAVTCERGTEPAMCPSSPCEWHTLSSCFPSLLFFFKINLQTYQIWRVKLGALWPPRTLVYPQPPGTSSSTCGLRALHGGPRPQDCRTLGGIRPPGATVERVSSVHASFLGRSSGRCPCV